MVFTKEDFWYMSNAEWEETKGLCFDADYLEWPDIMPESFSEEKAWKDIERWYTPPNYSEDYMWDPANQFGSYGEYAEWLAHQQGTEEEFKRNDEYFQFHHLLGKHNGN